MVTLKKIMANKRIKHNTKLIKMYRSMIERIKLSIDRDKKILEVEKGLEGKL